MRAKKGNNFKGMRKKQKNKGRKEMELEKRQGGRWTNINGDVSPSNTHTRKRRDRSDTEA